MMMTTTAPPPELLRSPSEEEDDEDEDDDEPRAAVAAVIAEIGEAPEEQLGEEADHAGDDHRDHHHLHVAVADMGEFVAEHRLDLLVVERVQQAGGDGDGILPLVEPGRVGVQRVAVA